MQLHVAVRASVLSACQERRPVLVHLVRTTTDHLDRCGKLSGLAVTELPSERRHKVLTEWHGNLKDEAIIGSVSFDSHASATDETLKRHWVPLRSRSRGCQQSLHLFGVGRHLTVVRFKDLLKFCSSICIGLRTLGCHLWRPKE